jgi:hypothetical protein
MKGGELEITMGSNPGSIWGLVMRMKRCQSSSVEFP